MTKTNTRILLSTLLVVSVIFLYPGCVDTGVENIDTSFDFYSEVSVANLVPGSGTATIALNSEQIGTAAAGAQTSSVEMQSGSKTMSVSYTNLDAESFKFTLSTESRMGVYIISDGTTQSVVRRDLRYTWQTKDSDEGAAIFPSDTTQISFFNGSPDVVADGMTISGGGVDTTITFSASVSFEGATSYFKIASTSSTSYTIDIIQDDTTFTSFSLTAAPQYRYTAAIYDSAASIKYSVFTDD